MSFRPRLAQTILLPALLATVAVRADPILSEFMASNNRTIADEEGKSSDWIEIHNPDATPVNLAGWYLTDDLTDKLKWQFPAVTVPAGGYLIVWASGENRRDATKPLHANFALDSAGEYLALVKPDGITAVTEFAPAFPAQFEDFSYGVTQPMAVGEAPVVGFFRNPTPGARNGGASTLLLAERVAFSRAAGPFTGTVSLTLSGAATGQRIRYTLTAPGPNAANSTLEPGPTAPEYTGPIAIAASTIVRASVYAADNIAHGFPSTAHYVRLAGSGAARLDNFSSQLPILLVDTHGTGKLEKDGIDHPAWIYSWSKPAIGDTPLGAAPSTHCPGSTSVHGQSSADFDKKSLSLKFRPASGQAKAPALFGLPTFESWELIGPWYFDRTFVYNAFVYALSNRLGRWAPRTQFVEVFYNNNGGDLDLSDYAGIYILTDSREIDSKRIDITKISPTDIGPNKITGGYVIHSDPPDAAELNFQTRRGFPGGPLAIGVRTPKLANLPQEQRDYIKGYVQGLDDALLSDLGGGWRNRTYLDYIDQPSWIDHHILNLLPMNVDGLWRSAFFTKDRGGRLVAGPVWDFDRSLGGGDPRADRPDVWSGPFTDGATDYWQDGWWGLLAQDPEFVQAWADRWHQLRRNELSTPSLLALIDSLAAQIGPAAAARDAAKWPANLPLFAGGWQGEIDHLKDWVTRRVTWIDAQLIAPPALTADNDTLTVTPAPGTQLAYTTDGTDPRAFGGAPAQAVRLSSSPITVPSTANLQARSYRAVPRPGIPTFSWSSVSGGTPTSAPVPRPRLLNLSSRSFVGADENILIAGVVVNDTAGKQYLARAVGPALTAFGVAGALSQPVLTILDSAGRQVARNAGWESGPDANDIPDLAKAVGAFPFAKGSRDSALLARLPAGQYTLQVSSATTATGVSLAELYEIDSGVGRTLNLSTRGLVRAGDELLIGGVVILGPGPKRLLIRAVGPTLGAFGVAGALPDPVLSLYNGSTPVATNDDWGTPSGATAASGSDITAAAAAVGAFALAPGTRDAVLLLTLPAGAYTAQIAGKSRASGVILLEIYEVP
ncbi:MAG: CotH kinase family protein [Opitutaceae bacterium]